MNERFTYLVDLAAWAIPVVALQWFVGWRTLRVIRSWISTWILATLYLSAADRFAIAEGIWRINPSRTIGLSVLGLPLEEVLFFGLTNLMVIESYVLLSSSTLRERAGDGLEAIRGVLSASRGERWRGGYRDGLIAAAIGAQLSAVASLLFGGPSILDPVANALIGATPLALATILVTQTWLSAEAQHALAALGALALLLLVGGVLGILSRHPQRAVATGAAIVALVGAIGAFPDQAVSVIVFFIPLLIMNAAELRRERRGVPRLERSGLSVIPRRELAGRLAVASGALVVAGVTVLRDRRSVGDLLPQGGALQPIVASRAAATGWNPRLLADCDGLPQLTPLVTSSSAFYRMSKDATDPFLDLSNWQLTVSGRVCRPLSLGIADLLSLPYRGRWVTLECVDNPVGGPLIGNAHWVGVPLRELLNAAGLASDAERVVAVSSDGEDEAIPLSRVDEIGPLVVYGMNGAPLPREHGFPVRLLVPGYYGFKSVKWLTRLVLDGSGLGYWAHVGWSDLPPIASTARIDVARREGRGILVAGIAIAGSRGIDRVEVRADGGAWLGATLLDPPLDLASWQQWRVSIPTEARIVEARVIDRTGSIPPEGPVASYPGGAAGWTRREVTG